MAPLNRVLLLCNSYPPEIGAAPLRMQGMAHLLRDAGYEVAVLAGMPNYPTGRVFPEYQGKQTVTETIEGITVCRLPFFPSHSASRIRRTGSLLSLSSALLRHGGAFIESFSPQRMIISSPPLPLALCGAWLARSHKVPFLLNISDLWPLTAKELGALREGPIYHSLQKAESWLFRRAQGWIGQSEEILHYMSKRVSGNKPLFLYRNLPPVRLSNPTIPITLPAGLRKVVYAGLIGPVQGILDIAQNIDFAAHNLELHLYGDGVDRNALEVFTEQHPERGVIYKGLLAPDDVFEKLPNYDFALASLRTGIYGAVPSKVYAALAAGLPVIFMGSGEGAALIEKHQSGWAVPSGDFAALRQQLAFVSKMPSEALQKMRTHILQINYTQFDVVRQGADFVSFFRKTDVGK